MRQDIRLPVNMRSSSPSSATIRSEDILFPFPSSLLLRLWRRLVAKSACLADGVPTRLFLNIFLEIAFTRTFESNNIVVLAIILCADQASKIGCILLFGAVVRFLRGKAQLVILHICAIYTLSKFGRTILLSLSLRASAPDFLSRTSIHRRFAIGKAQSACS